MSAREKDCEKATKTSSDDEEQADANEDHSPKLKMPVEKPTPTTIGSSNTVVGSAPAQPDSSGVVNCISVAMGKPVGERANCLSYCSQMASQIGVDYQYIYWQTTGTYPDQAGTSSGGYAAAGDNSLNNSPGLPSSSSNSSPNSSTNIGESNNAASGARNGGSNDETLGSGTSSVGTNHGANSNSGNISNSTSNSSTANTQNPDETHSGSPGTLTISPIPPLSSSNDNSSSIPIGLILGIAIPALLLLLLLLAFLLCIRKRKRKPDGGKAGAMINTSPTSPETQHDSFIHDDMENALIPPISAAHQYSPTDLELRESPPQASPVETASAFSFPHVSENSRIDKPFMSSSFANEDHSFRPYNPISDLYSEKYISGASGENVLPLPMAQKMQSGVSSNGIYSLYGRDSNAEIAATTAAVLAAKSDSSVASDPFDEHEEVAYQAKVSQDLRNVDSTVFVQNLHSRRASVVPAIYDPTTASSVDIQSTKSFKSSKSTLSTRSSPLEKEITQNEFIPSAFEENNVEIQDSHIPIVDSNYRMKKQISNENTAVDIAISNSVVDIEHPSEISAISKEPDTLVENEIRSENFEAKPIGKLDIPVPAIGPVLEKSEEKKQFPVAMVTDTPGRFELKQEPKKQPTWMWKKQFVNPAATETSFNPVIPEDEEDEDDIDMYAPPAPTSHVAIESYYPRERDEMYIQKGDLIGIEKEYGDGWARGQNISQSRKRGVFPLAMVTPIKSGPSQAVRKGRNWRGNGAVACESEFQAGSLKLVPRTKSMRRLQRKRSQASVTASISSGDSK